MLCGVIVSLHFKAEFGRPLDVERATPKLARATITVENRDYHQLSQSENGSRSGFPQIFDTPPDGSLRRPRLTIAPQESYQVFLIGWASVLKTTFVKSSVSG